MKQKIITFVIYLLRVGRDDRNRTKMKSATTEQVISGSLSLSVWSVAKVRNFCLFACLCIWSPLPGLFMISFIQTEKMDHSAGCMLHKEKDISFRQQHPHPTLSLCQLELDWAVQVYTDNQSDLAVDKEREKGSHSLSVLVLVGIKKPASSNKWAYTGNACVDPLLNESHSLNQVLRPWGQGFQRWVGLGNKRHVFQFHKHSTSKSVECRL